MSSQPTASATSRVEANSTLPALTLRGKRVVICEDEGLMLMQLKRSLTQAGLIVVGIADNGETAVQTALREQPDIILMDIQMPKLNGLQAAERILHDFSVCIVMLTAFADESYRQQAHDIGTCGYILKPITRDNLMPQIQTAFEKFHQS